MVPWSLAWTRTFAAIEASRIGRLLRGTAATDRRAAVSLLSIRERFAPGPCVMSAIIVVSLTPRRCAGYLQVRIAAHTRDRSAGNRTYPDRTA
jgi:hypothetical protein